MTAEPGIRTTWRCWISAIESMPPDVGLGICLEGKTEWDYPAGDELPLTGMLRLGCSETGRGEIVPRRNEHGEK